MGTLGERMTALEGDVAQIREEWKVVAQTPLIQTRLLNALRETQVEQGADIHVLKHDVHELKQGQQTIVGMLTILIERD